MNFKPRSNAALHLVLGARGHRKKIWSGHTLKR
jgi:hypothetical protein